MLEQNLNLIIPLIKIFISVIPILLFIFLIKLIINFIEKQVRKTNFKKRNFMQIITAKQIAEAFNKNSKEINEAFVNIGYAEKCSNGYTVTQLGKSKGGEQNFYMGKANIRWTEEILKDDIFINEIKKEEKEEKEQKEEKQEKQENFRDKFKAEYRTNDGHYVRSRAEVIISNWLFGECIAHAYEKRVPIEEDMYCDFYIPKGKIYIEFWGYEEDEKYLARKEKKKHLYKKYSLNLIEIDNEIINNIDDFLPKELLKFGIKLNLD